MMIAAAILAAILLGWFVVYLAKTSAVIISADEREWE